MEAPSHTQSRVADLRDVAAGYGPTSDEEKAACEEDPDLWIEYLDGWRTGTFNGQLHSDHGGELTVSFAVPELDEFRNVREEVESGLLKDACKEAALNYVNAQNFGYHYE